MLLSSPRLSGLGVCGESGRRTGRLGGGDRGTRRHYGKEGVERGLTFLLVTRGAPHGA